MLKHIKYDLPKAPCSLCICGDQLPLKRELQLLSGVLTLSRLVDLSNLIRMSLFLVLGYSSGLFFHFIAFCLEILES